MDHYTKSPMCCQSSEVIEEIIFDVDRSKPFNHSPLFPIGKSPFMTKDVEIFLYPNNNKKPAKLNPVMKKEVNNEERHLKKGNIQIVGDKFRNSLKGYKMDPFFVPQKTATKDKDSYTTLKVNGNIIKETTTATTIVPIDKFNNKRLNTIV